MVYDALISYIIYIINLNTQVFFQWRVSRNEAGSVSFAIIGISRDY